MNRSILLLVLASLLLTVLTACQGPATDSQSPPVCEDCPTSAPIAAFTTTASSGEAPLVVGFDASTSTVSDDSAATYSWAYGDGGMGSGLTSEHTYSTAGNYIATLAVIDDQGITDTATATITVFPSFSFSFCDAAAGIKVDTSGGLMVDTSVNFGLPALSAG